MGHTITEAELADYVEKQRDDWKTFAMDSSQQSFKKLEFCIGWVAPLYRVRCDGRDIYIGSLKETAVREYNALLP